MKKVAVVIPNYNGIEYMDRCLKALENQKYKKFEVVIVDNGSSDESYNVKGKYKLDLNVINLDQNYGFSVAVNTGIKATNAEYVILLNNDAFATPNFVENLVGRMDSDEKIFSAQALMLQENRKELVDSAGDYFCAMGWGFSRGKDGLMSKYIGKANVFSSCAGAAIYRKSILDEIGLFDEEFFAYLEDVDIGYRARLAGYKNVLVPEAMVFHVGSGSTGARHNGFKVQISARNTFLVMYKNFAWWQWVLNAFPIGLGILVKYIYFSSKKMGKEYKTGIFQYKTAKKSVTKFKAVRQSLYWKIQLELMLNCFRRLVK